MVVILNYKMKAKRFNFVCEGCGKSVSISAPAYYRKKKRGAMLCTKCSRERSWTKERWKEKVEKTRQTWRDRYGADTPFADEDIAEKRRQTFLRRYGTDWAVQNDEVKRKARDMIRERYGTNSVFESEIVKEKIRETLQQRYGVDQIGKAPEITEKRIKKQQETVKSKYDVDNVARLPEVQSKRLETIRKRYGVSSVHKENIEQKIETMRGRVGMFEVLQENGTVFTLFCPSCKKQWTWSIYGGAEQVTTFPYCGEFSTGRSRPETRIAAYVQGVYSGPVVLNDRAALSPKEIDIWLPKLQLGIELDGIHWHQDDRSFKKWEMAREKGIRLITIFDRELSLYPEGVMSVLYNAVMPRLYLRLDDCDIENTYHEFFQKYYVGELENVRNGYTFIYKGAPVAAVCYNENETYYCVAPGYKIKDWKVLIKNVLYSERRLFNGDGEYEEPRPVWAYDYGKTPLFFLRPKRGKRIAELQNFGRWVIRNEQDY